MLALLPPAPATLPPQRYSRLASFRGQPEQRAPPPLLRDAAADISPPRFRRRCLCEAFRFRQQSHGSRFRPAAAEARLSG